MAKPKKISVDVGNGFTKVVFGTQPTQRLDFPSVTSMEDETMTGFDSVGLSGNHDFVIEFEGKRWAIGDTVITNGLMPVKITGRTRIGTDYYRALFAASLVSAYQQSCDVEAIVSLPPANYWDKETQKAALSGEYTVKLGNDTYNYNVSRDKLRVVPEGWGTAMLFCINDKGEVKDSQMFNSEIGVLDIGTKTTDFIYLSSMKIVRSGTDSSNHALSDIHHRLKTFASSQGVDIDDHLLDGALRAGYFLRGGKRITFKDQIDSWSSELARTISGKLRSTWSGGDSVETILATGGGSFYSVPFLEQEFEHIRSVINEEANEGVKAWESNAVGAYRYLAFLELAGGK